MGKRVLWALTVGVLLVGAVIAATWPLARDLENVVALRTFADDRSCAVWHSWNVVRQLSRGEDPFFAPDFFWPNGLDTTLYLWNLLVPLLRAPLYLLAHPMRACPLSDLFLAVLNGLGGYVLGRVVGGRRSAGLAAGLFAATSAFTWSEFHDGRGEQGLIVFLLLAIAGVFALLRGGGRGVAVGTGAAFAAAASCYWMYGYFLVLATAALVTVALVRRRLDRPTFVRLVEAGLVAVLLTLPSFLPVFLRIGGEDSVYQRALLSDAQIFHRVEGLSLTSLAWPFAPEELRSTHPRTTFATRALLVVGLAIPAVRRRSGWLPFLGLGALVLALGPVLVSTVDEPVVVGGRSLGLPYALVGQLPGLERLWWPVRWMALVLVATAGILAACVAALPGPRSRACLVAVAAALGILECHAVNISTSRDFGGASTYAVPELFEMLGEEPGQHPLVQVPLHGMGYLQWHPYHQQPVDGGIGDGNPTLMPPSFEREVAGNPTMSALSRISKGDTLDSWPDSAEGDLCELGYHYLVYWKEDPGYPQNKAVLEQLMRRLPDHADARLFVWRLRPCAKDAPLPGWAPSARRVR